MSLIFKKENGYPVDLDLELERADDSYYNILVEINGSGRPDLMFSTKDPFNARRHFAKGFFAGYEHANKQKREDENE